ncbi:MAG TPA: hypothetical protein VLR49_03125 [Ferruginibacter sp.]|nr:hypothetical protein [Ferruginibacter sp.]
MKSNLKYPVFLIKQIPYFSKLLKGIVSVCFIICLIAWFLFFPSTDSGNEMKTVAMIEGTSQPIKWLILASGLGLIPLYFLYVKLRIRKPALLLFNDDNIVLQAKKFIKIIPVLNIRSIQVHEPNLHSNFLSQKIKITILLFDSESLQLRIKHYEHSGEIVDSFLSYNDLNNRIKESANNLFESDIDS